MKTNRTEYMVVLIGLFVVGSMSTAWGGARIFLVQQGYLPGDTTPGTDVTIPVLQGEQVTLEIWVESSPTDVRIYQVHMPDGCTASAGGSMDFVSPPLVDVSNWNWLFAGLCPGGSGCIIVIHPWGPNLFAWPSYAAAAPAMSAKYLGEFKYQASASALGICQIRVDAREGCTLLADLSIGNIPYEEDGANILIGAALDSDGDGLLDNVDDCPFDPDNDVDGDGLCGEIDVAPSVPSAAFTDGWTSGVVVGADAGATFVIRDGYYPAEGVVLVAQGTGSIHLTLDGSAGSYDFRAPGRYLITRHSVGINVIEGTATAVFEFGGVTQTIEVAAGGEATFVDLPRGVEVTAGGAPDAVTLNGAPLQPGTSVDTTPPLITAFNGSPLLVAVGGQVNFDVLFEDNVGDTNVATFDFGDGSTNAIVDPATSPTKQAHIYTAAEFCVVTVTVTDSRGSQATAQLIVVVYDPNAGACCDHDPFGPCTDGVTRAACDCPTCDWVQLGLCSELECPHTSIPTVSGWGLAILSLLLMAAAKIRFGRVWL